MSYKIYVGKFRDNGEKEIIRLISEPTEKQYPWYSSFLGPFKTIRAALWYIDHPFAQCQTIKEFEHMALVHQTQSELIKSYQKHLDK